jgi:rhodanese-related sulfurtransferase
MQHEPAPIVLDVRGTEEYAAGHLPGARHLPIDQITAHLAELPHDVLIVPY